MKVDFSRLWVVGLFLISGTAAEAEVQSEFSQSVDLTPLSKVAVQHNGRLKSFDSFSKTMMKWVSGPRAINGQSPTFSYLDLLFRPHAYHDVDIIYVKHKDVRRRIAQRLANDPTIPAERLEKFQKRGLIARDHLTRPEVSELLDDMQKDLIRTSKAVDAIRSGLMVSNSNTLLSSMSVVPPPGNDTQVAWLPIQRLSTGSGAPQDDVHAGMARRGGIPGLDEATQQQAASAWTELGAAWAAQDSAAANQAIQRLSAQLSQLNPQLYPPGDKLELESWYFKKKGLVWTWMIYLLAIVPLLMAVIYHWRGARRAGLVLFVIAFGFHTAAIGIRWYLSGRIPNSNMYEAIWAASWFGALSALVIEFIVRKTAMKNLFALGAAVCAMVAMMCSHFMPVQLNNDISHVMPVLNDMWLYIHTNVIIFSYCLIGMAAVTALLYLGYRVWTGNRDFARAGGAGHLMLAGAQSSPFVKQQSATMGQVRAGAQSSPFVKQQSATMGQVLDGATMVLMELAFILLWAGLVMGAIWADHSWGRPWGWDPKEVFALNTFIIFLVLVHVRLKVRDKALWTAVLACVGCGVMLFNWIVVNFVITGLHSYA